MLLTGLLTADYIKHNLPELRVLNDTPQRLQQDHTQRANALPENDINPQLDCWKIRCEQSANFGPFWLLRYLTLPAGTSNLSQAFYYPFHTF
ncbi:MAG TPA: hypothetical protein DCM28_07910 [Phycisphaerales bacterium]|nr:hypothetical protein [Phycisphaerales bacterium]